MNKKMTIEEIEFIYGQECDSNAQVTSNYELDLEPSPEKDSKIVEMDENNGLNNADVIRIITKQNAATNWLLVAILALLFLFMILKCD